MRKKKELEVEVTVQREPIGLDLVDFTPDYSLSLEENLKIYREKYRDVYGEYPPEPTAEDVLRVIGKASR